MSWHQDRPTVALELLAESGVAAPTSLVDVGGGAGRLVDALVAVGWHDVTVLDVSAVALQLSRRRVGEDLGVSWVEADVLDWLPDRRYAVWHDRAVFHFLVEPAQRQAYRAVLDTALEPDGLVVAGGFALDGPDQCSGLPVARYSVDGLAEAFGGSFRLVASRREEHRTPQGNVQPFSWVAMRR